MSVSISFVNINFEKISGGLKIYKLLTSKNKNSEGCIKFLFNLKGDSNLTLNIKGYKLFKTDSNLLVYNQNNQLLNKSELTLDGHDEFFNFNLTNEKFITVYILFNNFNNFDDNSSHIVINYLQIFDSNYQIFFFTNFNTFFSKYNNINPHIPKSGKLLMQKRPNNISNYGLLKNNQQILFIVDYVYMYNNLAETRYKFINYLVEKNKNIITVGTGSKYFTQGIDIFTLVKKLNIRPSIIIHANNFTKNKLLVSNLIKYPCKKALIIEDMHAYQTINDLIKYNGIHYVLYHCDCVQLDRIKLLNRQCRFINYPHFVDTNIFKNYDQRKEYDFILYGCTNENVYPFRSRLFDLIRKHRKFKVLYIPFPGYFIRNKKNITTGTRLAKMINKAYIGISTTSLHDYFLKKYLEIPACFTMVAGNIPSRYRKIFENNMIELRPGMSDLQIITILEKELSDKERLMEKINRLHNIIINNYSFENGTETFDKIIDAINNHQPINYFNRKLNLL